MSRLEQALRARRAAGMKAFIPYVTAGDPDLAATEAVVAELADAGAAAIEIGVPFSDPIADGPVIQRACGRALASGTRLADILAMCDRIRKVTDVPLVLFSYLNPLMAFGLERVVAAAQARVMDALLVTDLPREYCPPLRHALRTAGADLIPLLTPTSPAQRVAAVAAEASGFLYVVSRTGTTGGRGAEFDRSRALIRSIREVSDLPLALGFGIRDRADAERAWEIADAAVVGSALVELIESCPPADLLPQVRKFAAAFTATSEARSVRA